jgi:hypothetical protein
MFPLAGDADGGENDIHPLTKTAQCVGFCHLPGENLIYMIIHCRLKKRTDFFKLSRIPGQGPNPKASPFALPDNEPAKVARCSSNQYFFHFLRTVSLNQHPDSLSVLLRDPQPAGAYQFGKDSANHSNPSGLSLLMLPGCWHKIGLYPIDLDQRREMRIKFTHFLG